MRALLVVSASVAFLAACNQSGNDNQVLAEANASGNAASNAVENAVQQLDMTPLQKEQALALMHDRHESYERIGDEMKAITRELRSDSPNLAQVRQSAGAIAEFAPTVPSLFPAGTGPDAGKTEAKAEIWANPQDFAAKAHAFNQQAQAFNAAAQGGDLAAMKAAQADLGKACKACHDLYREEH